jgi:hypothetical protein
MTICKKLAVFIPVLALSAFTIGPVGTAVASDAPPPNAAPGNDASGGRHHNAAWMACNKQADDQKLEPGDARSEFIKNCMKNAEGTEPPPAT